jgi:hypothetical protein
MVHYDMAGIQTAPPLPTVCPKCGSHRTEVVGRSNNGKTLAIRCNACGARSEVTPDEDRHAGRDEVTAELEAILAVGQALTRVQNADGRRRVLNWAVERFNANVHAPKPPARPATAPDPMLLVDGLGDLFEAPGHVPSRGAQAAVVHERLDDLFEPAPAAQPEETQCEARDEPALDVLVADFVSDFRRLAVEWQRA